MGRTKVSDEVRCFRCHTNDSCRKGMNNNTRWHVVCSDVIKAPGTRSQMHQRSAGTEELEQVPLLQDTDMAPLRKRLAEDYFSSTSSASSTSSSDSEDASDIVPCKRSRSSSPTSTPALWARFDIGDAIDEQVAPLQSASFVPVLQLVLSLAPYIVCKLATTLLAVRATLKELDFTLDGMTDLIPNENLSEVTFAGASAVDDLEEMLWQLADPDGGRRDSQPETSSPASLQMQPGLIRPAMAQRSASSTAVSQYKAKEQPRKPIVAKPQGPRELPQKIRILKAQPADSQLPPLFAAKMQPVLASQTFLDPPILLPQSSSEAPAPASPSAASSTCGTSVPHNRKEWSAWEDDTIKQGVQELGLRWRAIASRLPGRSDDAVRNRWARLQGGGGGSSASDTFVCGAKPTSSTRQKRDSSETRHRCAFRSHQPPPLRPTGSAQ
eukprot:6198491-Pleurochrysis_carterae.AAC.2